MKTYTRQGVKVHCVETLEDAEGFLKTEGFDIKRTNIPALGAAISWYKRAILEGKRALVVKWGHFYALGEKPNDS
jgi:hypothetical protein